MTAAEALPQGGAELQNGVHEVLQGDPRKLTLPIKTVQDKYELLPAFLKVRAFVLPEQSHTLLGAGPLLLYALVPGACPPACFSCAAEVIHTECIRCMSWADLLLW